MADFLFVAWCRFLKEDSANPLPDRTRLTDGWELVRKNQNGLEEHLIEMLGTRQDAEGRWLNEETEFALIKEYSSAHYLNSKEYSQVLREAKWLILALRSVRMSRLSVDYQVLEKTDKKLQFSMSLKFNNRYFLSQNIPKSQVLFCKGDIKNIKKSSSLLLELFNKNKGEDNALLSSLQIYDSTLKQELYIPRIILIVTCLETIYAYSNHNITEQLAFGASYFLSKNYEERTFIYKKMKKLYNLRSSLAHSGNLPSKGKWDEKVQRELMDFAFQVYQETISKILKDGFNELFTNKEKSLAVQSEEIKLGKRRGFTKQD